MKQNPWRHLPESAPYVLPEDKLAVDVFNESADERHRLQVETPPEPFFGPFDAPIVTLLLNPGVAKDGKYEAGLASRIRSSMPNERHFYIGGDNRWWKKLVAQLGRDREGADLSAVILSVEFFPYRSISFGCGQVRLPSQEFSFDLVRLAIQRKAAIIICRGARYWTGAVPELQRGGSLIQMQNPQVAALSGRNLGKKQYERILAALGRRRMT